MLTVSPVSGIDSYRRVCVVEDVPDKCLYMAIRQPVEHVPAFAPTLQEVLIQEDPQAL